MNISDIFAINRILSIEYNKRHAPIVELVKAQTDDPFKILIATILSARTKDETTAFAVSKLFKVVKKMEDLQKIPIKKLEKLIFPVGFYHTKARHLKLLPDAVEQKFGGKIPQTVEELCELPGVGRKTANLVVAVAFDKPAICVDVHVHRICNRLGLLKTKTPFDTEMTLRKILPKRIWKTWNSRLVSYGQTVCSPISPKCSICVIYKYCKRIGVKGRNRKDS
jgi:endonuclease III